MDVVKYSEISGSGVHATLIYFLVRCLPLLDNVSCSGLALIGKHLSCAGHPPALLVVQVNNDLWG